MSKIIIVKNTTLSDISVAGTTILASDQHTINLNRLPEWRTDPNIESLINSGDLVINDGVVDLGASLGLAYLQQDTPPNILYVSPTGSDTSGDGGFTNPYRSIKFALSKISGSSPTNRFTVVVMPAVYVEDNPLVVPTHVEMRSIGGLTSARIEALNPSSNLIEVSGVTEISNFTLSGVLSGALIHQNDVSGVCVLAKVTFDGCDLGINCINGTVSFVTLSCEFGAIIGEVVHVESGGVVNGSSFNLNGNITASKVFHALGGELDISNFVVKSSSVTDAVHIENTGTSRLTLGAIEDVNNAIRLSTSANLSIGDVDIVDTTGFDFLIEDTTPILTIAASRFRRDKISVPPEYEGVTGFYLNREPTVSGLRVLGNVVSGRPEVGTELSVGRGDSYTRGMVVLTTDNTATSSTDGGNLTDVSTEASSYESSTFSFQGTTADHTILFGSDIDDDGDKLKFWGLNLKQTTAANENVKKSFVFERWDGTQWSEFGVMASFVPEAYIYSKEVFIRANQTEHIQFGLDNNSTWAKKTINGKNLYWIRVRITNDLVTAPVFEQSKLVPSGITINGLGFSVLHGLARYKKTILSTGNIFGESGSVTFSMPTVGSGGTSWSHNMKNNQLRLNGALYLQLSLPRGIDTSFPLEVIIYYQDINEQASTDGTIQISALPMEVSGVLAADETGGVVPVPRTISDVNLITVDTPQVINKPIALGNVDIIGTIRDVAIDVSDSYQGDIVAIKIQYTDVGSSGDDLVIWGVEISAVSWLLGDRI